MRTLTMAGALLLFFVAAPYGQVGGAGGEATDVVGGMGYEQRKRYRWEVEAQEGGLVSLQLIGDARRVMQRTFRVDGPSAMCELRGDSPPRCFTRR